MRKSSHAGSTHAANEVPALLMRAISAHQKGALGEARQLYKAVIARDRAQFDALHMLGVLEAQTHNVKEALGLFDRALKANPRSADALANKARALTELRRHEDALVCYERAVSINPEHLLALLNQGCTLLALNRSAQALEVFNRLLRIRPDVVLALYNRAIALCDLHRYEEAVASCNQALALKPDYAEALQCRGIAYEFMRKRARTLNPGLDYLLGSLLLSQSYCCEWESYEQNKLELISAVRGGNRVITPFASLSLLDSPRDQLACANVYVADKFAAVNPPLWRGRKHRHQKIRLAYVSADYRSHPVAYLIANLFERHDRSRLETVAISLWPDDKSEIRGRIKSAFDEFIDAAAMNDREIAALLYRREIDIAVDLAGFTQNHRHGIFAYKPAPIQVSYLGYPGTTGSTYWITSSPIAGSFRSPSKAGTPSASFMYRTATRPTTRTGAYLTYCRTE